jgi:hypothetical protein
MLWAKPQKCNSPVYGKCTWYSHSLGLHTFFQSLVLGLVLGPIVTFLHGDLVVNNQIAWGNILWGMFAMALAPIVVDAMKPTVVQE